MANKSNILRGGAVDIVSELELTACTSLVADIEVAPNATDPLCAEAMVAMPEEIAGHERRRTDSQSTAAWGEPAAAVFRCGVQSPGPTTDECVSANGVDWLAHQTCTNYSITTYGREPA